MKCYEFVACLNRMQSSASPFTSTSILPLSSKVREEGKSTTCWCNQLIQHWLINYSNLIEMFASLSCVYCLRTLLIVFLKLNSSGYEISNPHFVADDDTHILLLMMTHTFCC